MRPVTIWATNLRTARERSGLTKAALAGLLGCSDVSVGRWVAGTRTPKPAERIRLARILDADIDELFPLDEPAVVTAARRVVASRTVTDLRRAVSALADELASLDAPNERGAA